MSIPEDNPSINSAGSVFAKWCGADQLLVLSWDTLVVQQKQDASVRTWREIAIACEEGTDMAEGFYQKDDVLMKKETDQTVTENWSVAW